MISINQEVIQAIGSKLYLGGTAPQYLTLHSILGITFIKALMHIMLMAQEGSSNAGVFAMSMAILSIVLPLSAFPLGFVGGIVCSILGLIFGIIQLRSEKNAWGVCAIIFSIIGLAVSIIVISILASAVNAVVDQYNQLQASGIIDDVKAAADLAKDIGAFGA